MVLEKAPGVGGHMGAVHWGGREGNLCRDMGTAWGHSENGRGKDETHGSPITLAPLEPTTSFLF